MYKLILLLFLTIGIISPLHAAPCYGTKMPRKKQIFMGLQNYTVFKRYLQKEYGKIRSTQEFLLISYGVCDWFSLDLKGSWGNIKQHAAASDEIDYPSFLGGGYGFRARIFQKDKIKGVFGFQHISIHPYSVDIGETKHKAVLDDWQFSLLGSYSFSKITPFIGAKWSRMDNIHWVNDTNRKRQKSDTAKSIGLISGFDLPFGENAWLNFEGQFFDAEAMAVSVNYSF